jgi:hypothetical protein
MSLVLHLALIIPWTGTATFSLCLARFKTQVNVITIDNFSQLMK